MIFELEQLLKQTLNQYQAVAELRKIRLEFNDDLASFVNLDANSRKVRLLLDTLLQPAIYNFASSRVSLSTRQILRSEKEILLEFLLQHDGQIPNGPEKISYYRSLAAARKLIKELKGTSQFSTSLNTQSLRFIINCKLPADNLHSPAETLGAFSQTILVVDDNEINLQTITRILQREGLQVETASNGTNAINMLERGLPADLVIMDAQMPHMDGMAATRFIRRKLRMSVPVIGMVAGENISEEQRCMDSGMNACVHKPFSSNELLATVFGMLSERVEAATA